MHRSVLEWVGEMVTRLGVAKGPTLEVGSLNVNGSVRDLFTGPYAGVDVVAGPGVDWVIEEHDPMPTPDGWTAWPVVVSTETLEHVTRPWLTLRRVAESMVDAGHLLLTCRGFNETWSFPYHEPSPGRGEDLWRFSVGGLTALLWDAGFVPKEVSWDPMYPGVFAWAQRRAGPL